MNVISFPQQVLEKDDWSVNQILSTYLTSIMLHPREVDQDKLCAYLAKRFTRHIKYLIDTFGYDEEQAGRICFVLNQGQFGSYENFLEILASSRYLSPGVSGSIEQLACRGKFAGEIFTKVIQGCGIGKAAEELIEEGCYRIYFEGTKVGASSTIKHIWSQYKSVAYLWSTLLDYEIFMTKDGFFDFGKAEPLEERGEPGFLGFVKTAEATLEDAKGIILKQTDEELVDVETWVIRS
ncbi:MAG: hypothetical protein CL942_16050 [Desulfovibrio sp.]|nr:hypothetical protein [Desulfovibrio sp.]|tara:strand:- start:32344 stop:33054 length:711 start_codon:yes stop_codon:yes gene_type:complete